MEQQWRTMTVDERYAHRAALTAVVYQGRRPWAIAMIALYAVLVILGLLTDVVAVAVAAGAFLPVIAGIQYLSCRRATARVLPVGSTIGAALATHGLVVRDETASVDIPYGSVIDAVPVRDMVLVKRRRLHPLMVPAKVLTDEDRTVLLELARQPAPEPVLAAAASGPTDPDALVRWLVVDSSYAWAATRAVLRTWTSSLSGAGTLAIVAVVAVGVGVIGGPVQGVIGAVIMMVVLAFVVRHGAARQAPVGTWILLVAGPDGLLTESAQLRALSPWSQLAPMVVRRHVVVLPMRGMASVRVLPRAGLDDEAIATIARYTGA